MIKRREWLLCGLFVSVLANAQYDENNHFGLDAGVDVIHDNNVFRLSDNEALGILSRYDVITTPHGGVSYKNELSRQTVALNALVFSPRYDLNNVMNYNGDQLTGRWNGRVGEHWQPDGQISQTHQLASFEDAQLGVKDMIDERNVVTGLQYGGDNYAHVRGELVWRTSDHDNRSFLNLTEQGWGGEAGLKTSVGTTLTFQHQQREIVYTDNSTQDYRRYKDSLELYWPISEPLFFKLKGGLIDWNFEATDDSTRAVFGSSELNWKTNDKLSWLLRLERDADDPGTNLQVSISNNYMLQSDWLLTDKISTQLRWNWKNTKYGVVNTTSLQQEENITNIYRWSLDWKPYTALTTEFYAELQRRTSNILLMNYSDEMVGVNLKLRY